ncbi:MAG: hypothetical protein LBJ18_02345 [Rickettsiales bacterium]|nr:hypothetical protein [Rickettsiales bacterium]
MAVREFKNHFKMIPLPLSALRRDCFIAGGSPTRSRNIAKQWRKSGDCIKKDASASSVMRIPI